MNSLGTSYRALIFGATGTIGGAFAQHLQNDPNCSDLLLASRSGSPYTFDLLVPESIEQLAIRLAPLGPIDLIIDATGLLHTPDFSAEKRLADINALQLQETFTVNAVSKALMLKHFCPLLPTKRRSIFAQMSARVGSISDNKLGGWYAYRASKAAANMLLQTAAIEVARTRPESIFAALQPGTVASALSAPFAKGHPLTEKEVATSGLLVALDQLAPRPGAHFIDHTGQPIPW